MTKTNSKRKADGRHDQEVHSRRCLPHDCAEGLPGLRPPSPTLRHVLGDYRLGDLDAELGQLAVDARRTPQPIGQAHLSDRAADLHRNAGVSKTLWTMDDVVKVVEAWEAERDQ